MRNALHVGCYMKTVSFEHFSGMSISDEPGWQRFQKMGGGGGLGAITIKRGQFGHACIKSAVGSVPLWVPCDARSRIAR